MTDSNGDPICVGAEWCQFLNGPGGEVWFDAIMTLVFGGGVGLVLLTVGASMMRS